MANLGRTPPQYLAYTPRKVMQAAAMCLALRGPYMYVVKKKAIVVMMRIVYPM